MCNLLYSGAKRSIGRRPPMEPGPDFVAMFIAGDVRFLTFRGKHGNARQQTIGFVSDHVRKVSSTFFIVREFDKNGATYHFHVLLKLNKTPPDSWYIKGCHLHMTRVGHLPPLPLVFSRRDLWECPLSEHKQLIKTNLEHHIKRLVNQSNIRIPAIERTIVYMKKELFEMEPYVNYVLFERGKFTPQAPARGDVVNRAPPH